jgi:twitching motility protein PilT
MTMQELLKAAVATGCSDIHLCVGQPPMIRLHGLIRPLDPSLAPLSSMETKQLVYAVLVDIQKARVERELDFDSSFSLPGVARFRLNVLFTSRGLEAALRVVATKVPAPAAISLTPAMTALASLPRGLVLVTGPTGSGKSTTIASLVDQVNSHRASHILTIEDPIEFVFEPKKSLIRQREVGLHTLGFPRALRAALREDPDVIVIGEMRDPETIALAVTAAETGHLCFSTLHTRDAPSAISRIIDAFSPHQQAQIRAQVAVSLRAVISQLLLPRKDGRGRVVVRELMLVTPPIANHIRDNKLYLIPSVIETSQALGMVQMDRSIADALRAGLIDLEVATINAQNADVMLQLAHGRRQ